MAAKYCTTHCPESGLTRFCGGPETHPDNFDCKAHCEANNPCRGGAEQIGGVTGGGSPNRPNQGGVGGFSRATGGFKSRRLGGTGQPARFANQSGNGKGEIFGLSTEKALIVVGVAVAAYFIIKKVK